MSNLGFLLFLLIMSGCGKKETSSANFEIARAFAVSNEKFDGGLTIHGRHLLNQKTFSVNLEDGTSVNLQLDKGPWEISAVGWEGPSLLQGLPYCGHVSRNLLKDNEAVDLIVTKDRCADEKFAPLKFQDRTDPDPLKYTLRKLSSINSCKSFIERGATSASIISDVMFNPQTLNVHCNFMPNDLKSAIRSIRIRTLNKKVFEKTSSPGLNSGCFGSSDSSIDLSASNFRLPTRQIPFLIETFKDQNCQQPLTNFKFHRGLAEGDASKFDHLIFRAYSGNSEVPSEMKLWLPGTDTRRALSPFMALLPSIQCYDGANYKDCPTAPASGLKNFHIPAGNAKLIIKGVNSCTNPTAGTNVSTVTCLARSEHIEVTLGSVTAGSGSFSINNEHYTFFAFNSTFENDRWHSQKNLIHLLGPSVPVTSSFFNMEEQEGDYGALAWARNLLAPEGAGGLFPFDSSKTFAVACGAASGSKTVVTYNYGKMAFETYKVVLTSSSLNRPLPYFCNTTDKDETNCEANGAVSSFHKRLLVYDYSYSTIEPFKVVEFHCSKPIGRLESITSNATADLKTNIKDIVNWNTGDVLHQRLEHLQIEETAKLDNGNWEPIRKARKMARLQKEGTQHVEAWSFHFNSIKDHSGDWNQEIELQELKTQSYKNLCLRRTSGTTTSTDPLAAFTETTLNTLRTTALDTRAATDNFDLTGAFPQSLSTENCTQFSALPTNNNKIDGDLEFQIQSLGLPLFTGKFTHGNFLSGE